MDSSLVEWEVQLPERGARAAGMRRARPRAKLRLVGHDGHEESMELPLAVGRKLAHLRDEMAGAEFDRFSLLWELDARQRACASERAQDLVARRDYSAQELGAKLVQDGYPQELCDDLVGRYQELGIIDDARYAATFMRSRLAQGWGPRKIEQELARRGIDARLVGGWPEEFLGEEDEESRAYELASRRRLPDTNAFEKIVRHLASRGFSLTVAKRVARRLLDERAHGEPDD